MFLSLFNPLRLDCTEHEWSQRGALTLCNVILNLHITWATATKLSVSSLLLRLFPFLHFLHCSERLFTILHYFSSVLSVRYIDLCDLVYSAQSLQRWLDPCMSLIHNVVLPCTYQRRSLINEYARRLQYLVQTTFCFLCLTSVERNPHTPPHFPKWTMTGWVDRERLMPSYPWTKSQLTWILNPTHECPWFIDAVPEEKFTSMSKGCGFTLEFDCSQTATTLQWNDVSCVECLMSLDSWSLPSVQMSLFPRVIFESVLFSESWVHFVHCPHDTQHNISPHCTVQQPAPSSLQIWLKWLSWFPWKPGAQRSRKIHFTLQQRAERQRDG